MFFVWEWVWECGSYVCYGSVQYIAVLELVSWKKLQKLLEDDYEDFESLENVEKSACINYMIVTQDLVCNSILSFHLGRGVVSSVRVVGLARMVNLFTPVLDWRRAGFAAPGAEIMSLCSLGLNVRKYNCGTVSVGVWSMVVTQAAIWVFYYYYYYYYSTWNDNTEYYSTGNENKYKYNEKH